MRIRFTIAAAVLVVAIVVAGVVAAQGIDTRPPWENEDGIWDMSQLSPTLGVVDSTGEYVGTIPSDYKFTGDTGLQPVTGPAGDLVGHFGPGGFWALGEPEPLPQEDAYSVIEEFDDAGTLRLRRTIHEGSDARTVIEEFNLRIENEPDYCLREISDTEFKVEKGLGSAC